jgi:hypothetical protein
MQLCIIVELWYAGLFSHAKITSVAEHGFVGSYIVGELFTRHGWHHHIKTSAAWASV